MLLKQRQLQSQELEWVGVQNVIVQTVQMNCSSAKMLFMTHYTTPHSDASGVDALSGTPE